MLLRLLEQALRETELHQHGRVAVGEALREEAHVAVRAAEDRTRRGQRPHRRARKRQLVLVREDHLVTVADGEAVLGQDLVRGRDAARGDGRNRLARREHDGTEAAREDAGVRHRLREGERTLDARLGGNRKDVDLVRLVGRVAVGVVNLHEEALADVRLVALRGERAVRKAERGVGNELQRPLHDRLPVLGKDRDVNEVGARDAEERRRVLGNLDVGINRPERQLDEAVERTRGLRFLRRLVARRQAERRQPAAKLERHGHLVGIASLGRGLGDLAVRDRLDHHLGACVTGARTVVHADRDRSRGDVDRNRVRRRHGLRVHRRSRQDVAVDDVDVLVAGTAANALKLHLRVGRRVDLLRLADVEERQRRLRRTGREDAHGA